MSSLRNLIFLILAIVPFVLASVVGIISYGLVSGFQGGVAFMRWLAK